LKRDRKMSRKHYTPDQVRVKKREAEGALAIVEIVVGCSQRSILCGE
jgi:hypothetical protein